MKKWVWVAFLFLVLMMAVVQAHEFWLQPSQFFYNPGEKLMVSFRVGENFMGEPWPIRDSLTGSSRISGVRIHHEKGVESLKDRLTEGPANNLEYTAGAAGTYMVALESTPAFIELEAGKFNDYLREDGLDDILHHRESTGTLGENATELYSRYAKLLVQVGGRRDDTYRKVAGFPVEIVPLQNPYTLGVGDRVRFRILFNGKALFGARVKVWNRHDNRTTVQNIYTLQDGTVETHISSSGMWMVSVVKMVPSKDAKAAWESFWGSLTFGIR